MNKLKIIIYRLMTLLIVFSGCKKEKDPLDNEQYIKQVYIVGSNKSNNEGMSVIKLAYSESADQEQLTAISVATGGSQKIDRDISVVLAEAGNEAISWYNYLYLYKPEDIRYQRLSSDLYRIPDKTIQIKSQEIYGTAPVYIKTANLHCDSLYTITIKIASVSEPDYISIRKVDTVLLLSVSLINDYSGNYQLQGKYYKFGATAQVDTVALALARTLKATDHHTVRFYHLSGTETIANAAASGVKINIGADNSVTITPWGTLNITSGGGTYDPLSKTFSIWYNYVETGVTYQFSGTLIRSAS